MKKVFKLSTINYQLLTILFCSLFIAHCFGQCVAPALTAKANGQDVSIVASQNSPLQLTANPLNGSNCGGTWEFAWTDGSHYWNGSSFGSAAPLYNSAYVTVNFSESAAGTYTALCRCSTNNSCSANPSSVTIYPPKCNILSEDFGSGADIDGAGYNGWTTSGTSYVLACAGREGTGRGYKVNNASADCKQIANFGVRYIEKAVNLTGYSRYSLSLWYKNNYSGGSVATFGGVQLGTNFSNDGLSYSAFDAQIPISGFQALRLTSSAAATGSSYPTQFDDICITGYPYTYCFPPVVYNSGQPQSQAVCEGGSAGFTVIAINGSSYQWQKNASNISGATNAIFTVNPVTSNDIGQSYRCIVTNSCGAVTSTAATLSLLSISPLANNRNAVILPPAGDRVELLSNASGGINNNSGNLEYAWSDGNKYWDGSGFNSSSQTFSTGFYKDIFVTVTANTTYTAYVRPVGNPACVASGKATVTIDGNLIKSAIPTPNFQPSATTPARYPWLYYNTDGLADYSYAWSRFLIPESELNLEFTYNVPVTITSVYIPYSKGGTANVLSLKNCNIYMRNNFTSNIADADRFYPRAGGAGGWTQVLNNATLNYANSSILQGEAQITLDNAFVYYGTGSLDILFERTSGDYYTGDWFAGRTASNYNYGISRDYSSSQATVFSATGNAPARVSGPAVNPVRFGYYSCTKIVSGPDVSTNKICYSNPINFSITAVGSANIKYQWQKDGNNLTGATNSQFSILNSQYSDAGVYRCIITDQCSGNITSSAVTIYIPVIVTQPQSSTIPEGWSTTFTSVAFPGPASYQWQKLEAGSWKLEVGKTSISYQLSTINQNDSGAYRCIITYPEGCELTSDAATLKINKDVACNAPTISAKANGFAVTSIAIQTNPLNLTANPSQAGTGCSGNWEYSWFDGTLYWNGSSFLSAKPVYNPAFASITLASSPPGTYTVYVRCSADTACLRSSSVKLYPHNCNMVFEDWGSGADRDIVNYNGWQIMPGWASSLLNCADRNGGGRGFSTYTKSYGACTINISNVVCGGTYIEKKIDMSNYTNYFLSFYSLSGDPNNAKVTIGTSNSFNINNGTSPTIYTYREYTFTSNDRGIQPLNFLANTPSAIYGANSKIPMKLDDICLTAAPYDYCLLIASITQQPSDRIFSGNSVSMTVGAENANHYRWQEKAEGSSDFNDITEGADFSGVFTNTLVILNGTGHNKSLFRCIVSNYCSNATSSAATLTVSGGCTPPTLSAFANGIKDKYVICPRIGVGVVKLSADISGGESCNGNWLYSWYNGSYYWDWASKSFSSISPVWKNISSVDSVIVNVSDSIMFELTVKCENIDNCTSKSTVNVIILKTPENVNASVGNPANGISHFMNITWNKINGSEYVLQFSKDKANWVTINDQLPTMNYFIHNTGDYPNGPVFYKVRSFLDNVECGEKMTADTAFTACDFPVLSAGNATPDGMELILQNDGNPSYTFYSIKCENTGQYVQPDGTLGAVEKFLTKTGWNLPVIMKSLLPDSTYCFYASAKNKREDIRTEGPQKTVCAKTLECTPVTIISQTGGQVSKCTGDTAALKVYASGTGNLYYQWQKSGTLIPGATNSVISFSSLTLQNFDIYQCVIRNSCSIKSSEIIMLKVSSKPALNVMPVVIHKSEGENVYFSVSPAGAEDFSYQWFKDGIPVTDATNDNLSLNNLTKADEGVYSCRIENECGYITRTIATIIIGTNNVALYGSVSYDNNASTPLSKVSVNIRNIENTYSNSSQTDSSGYYMFSSLSPGNYIITASADKKWGGGNPLDALIINRYFIGSVSSFGDELKKKAADVNNDNKINPTDALLINRRFIGVTNSFPLGDWVFESDTIPINSDLQYNFKGICVGDVNGDYNKIP